MYWPQCSTTICIQYMHILYIQAHELMSGGTVCPCGAGGQRPPVVQRRSCSRWSTITSVCVTGSQGESWAADVVEHATRMRINMKKRTHRFSLHGMTNSMYLFLITRFSSRLASSRGLSEDVCSRWQMQSMRNSSRVTIRYFILIFYISNVDFCYVGCWWILNTWPVFNCAERGEHPAAPHTSPQWMSISS